MRSGTLYRHADRTVRRAAHAHRMGHRHSGARRRWSPRAQRADRILRRGAWPRCVNCSVSFAAALRDPQRPAPCCRRAISAIYRNNVAIIVSLRARASSFPGACAGASATTISASSRCAVPRSATHRAVAICTGSDATSAPFLTRTSARAANTRGCADLARLEWSREQASIARVEPRVAAISVDALAPCSAEHLDLDVAALQLSAAAIASDFPILSRSGRRIRSRMRRQWINHMPGECGYGPCAHRSASKCAPLEPRRLLLSIGAGRRRSARQMPSPTPVSIRPRSCSALGFRLPPKALVCA